MKSSERKKEERLVEKKSDQSDQRQQRTERATCLGDKHPYCCCLYIEVCRIVCTVQNSAPQYRNLASPYQPTDSKQREYFCYWRRPSLGPIPYYSNIITCTLSRCWMAVPHTSKNNANLRRHRRRRVLLANTARCVKQLAVYRPHHRRLQSPQKAKAVTVHSTNKPDQRQLGVQFKGDNSGRA